MKTLFRTLLITILGLISTVLSYSQKAESKDTLFFKYTNDYLIEGKDNQKHFYLFDSLNDKGSTETIIFEIIDIQYNLDPKRILDIKNYIRNSNYYFSENDKNKLDDYFLSQFFNNYIIYFIINTCGKNEFRQVHTKTVIE